MSVSNNLVLNLIVKKILTIFFLFFSSSGFAKDVAFVNNSSTSAEWVYFSGASTAAEWVYFSGPSTAADWIHLTSSASADYTICFPSSFKYSKEHIAAIYILYLKK